MNKRFFAALTALVLGLFHLSVQAEDIDLFSGANSGTTMAPNLLLVMDNAANFSSSDAGQTCTIAGAQNSLHGTVGGNEQCALYAVIDSLTVTSTASVNIGVMVYNSSNVVNYLGQDCIAGGQGGCLVYPLTGLTTTTKPTILAWIASWKTTNGGDGTRWMKASSEATAAAMQESWAYYFGRTGISGKDYSGIAPSTNCKNFIVFIGNSTSASGSPGDSAPSGNGPKNSLEGTNPTALKNAFPVATTNQKAIITNTNTDSVTSCGTVNFPSNHENAGFYADEWSRYMNANRVQTYSIGFLGSGCKAEYAWILNSMAVQGGGKYFATTNYAELKKALETVLSEVRSVNSVFAAVSLPVSVNSQGTYLNQVFVGMFRPDPNGLPRWAGNIKQYKLGSLNGVFTMLDADGASAISSSGSEFIAECARSFWTPAATVTGDGYWTTLVDPNCSGYPASSNSPDGNLVEKGAQGYMLRKSSPASRNVKTCSPTFGSCTTTTDFNTSNGALTASLFDATYTSTQKDTLVNWVRGNNSKGEVASLNGVALTSTDMRPSAHGDVVHSRPAAINFGTDASPKVVVFYSANDGVLRAINGNRTTTFTVNATSVEAGAEFWSFVAPETFSKLKRLYDDDQDDLISAANPKGYGMDGPITAYRASNGDAWIYVPMRRGGRALYAFKVDGSTLAITLKWKRGCGDTGTSNCTNDANGDFRNIGQTWSPPTIFLAQNTGSTPLMLVGGGYDSTCEDTTSYSCASPIGNRLYLMNADTGVILKTFTTTRGVVADVTVVTDSSGYAKYIYTADLGGNVYRIDGASVGAAIDTTAPANWTMVTVAAVGCSAAQGPTCTSPPNRKFMFAPDVIVDGSDYIVVIGSGDREKPTNLSNTTQNYFFAIKDRPSGGAAWLQDPTNCPSPSLSDRLCLGSLLAVTQGVTPTQADLDSKKGWYMALRPNEQVVTGAIALFGVVYFTTHEPVAQSSTSCTPNLGTSRQYAVKYTNATAGRTSGDLFNTRLDAGLAPDLVVGKVTIDNSTVPFCIGCEGPLKPSQPVTTGTVVNPAKIRSYWFLQK